MSFHSVQLLQDDEKWVVLIVEDGAETRRTFDIEQHAHSYADGQRIRLKLPPLDQITDGS